MKSILLAAALAASAASGLDVHLVPINGHGIACAKRIVGKQLLGVGVVKLASQEPDDNGNFLVQIEGPNGADGQPKHVEMHLSPDQLCDFADSIESTTPGRN